MVPSDLRITGVALPTDAAAFRVAAFSGP